jgi:hypothetical protein
MIRAWTLLSMLLACAPAAAQFRDDFDALKLDPQGRNGWLFQAGDGTATMDFRQGGKGYASIFVDGTTDRRGIWWALVERNASDGMDLSLLRKPGHEVRIEARIRVSHAPRRVNLQVATQRMTGDEDQLMEFDIPDAERWHTISMTTHRIDAGPGDTLIAHLALMDWGLEKYRVDLDYIKVDIVEVARAGPDQGEAVPYHPEVADPKGFAQVVPVAEDAMIDLENTAMREGDWRAQEGGRDLRLLTVDGTHHVILRWDLSAYAGKKVARHGLLELTTQRVERKAEEVKDFGLLRVVEILGGDPLWDHATVTTDSFCHYEPLNRVLNTQMIIDWPATPGDGGKTYLTIGRPVLQRLIDGRSKGIAIKALGAIHAAFYSKDDASGRSARLYFDLEP